MTLKKRNEKTVSLPMLHRVGQIQPKTLDRKKRTVEVVWTTGARVLRRGFFEDFFEELSLENIEVIEETITKPKEEKPKAKPKPPKSKSRGRPPKRSKD